MQHSLALIHSCGEVGFRLEKEGKVEEARAQYEMCLRQARLVGALPDEWHQKIFSTIMTTLSKRMDGLRSPITESTLLVTEDEQPESEGPEEAAGINYNQSSSESVPWEDIVGLENTKRALYESVAFVYRYPRAFAPPHTRKPWSKILLYGPPGTGKTHLAKALTSQLRGVAFLSISSADILSCWLGKSEQKVVQLFDEAKAKPGGCVLFFDEIDSLCRKRTESEDETTRRVKNELLKQLDGVEFNPPKGAVVLVLASTNRPWELDSAVLRRFERRILVPMPDAPARNALLSRRLAGSAMSTEEILDIANRTEGFNCSDLNTLVNDGLMEAVREMDETTHWRVVDDPTEKGSVAWMPCEAGYSYAIQWDADELASNKKVPRAASKSDMEKALERARPSISAEENALYEKWTEQMGQRG